MNRIATIVTVVLLVTAAACAHQRSRLLPEAEIDGVVTWAARQGVPRGRVRSLHLPPQLATATVNGSATIAHLADGRICVLLVEGWGYKDNFDGVLACSAALHPGEIVHSPNYAGKRYVSLPGYGVFEELYVSSRRNDRTYDVYFDLN